MKVKETYIVDYDKSKNGKAKLYVGGMRSCVIEYQARNNHLVLEEITQKEGDGLLRRYDYGGI